MADTDSSSPIVRYNLVLNQLEYFNGSDWYSAVSHLTPASSVLPYTPVITGVGTATNISFFYKTDGVSVEIWGSFTGGTTTATAISFSLPINLNASHMPANWSTVGVVEVADNIHTNSLFFDGTTVTAIYVDSDLTTSGSPRPDKALGSSIWDNNMSGSVYITYLL